MCEPMKPAPPVTRTRPLIQYGSSGENLRQMVAQQYRWRAGAIGSGPRTDCPKNRRATPEAPPADPLTAARELRKFGHLHHAGARLDVGRDDVEDPSGRRVLTHMNHLQRRHH